MNHRYTFVVFYTLDRCAMRKCVHISMMHSEY